MVVKWKALHTFLSCHDAKQQLKCVLVLTKNSDRLENRSLPFTKLHLPIALI